MSISCRNNIGDIKEVTMKEKLDDYRKRLQKVFVGFGFVAAGGIGAPIYGCIKYNEPEAIAYFQHYLMITVPITVATAVYAGIRLKGYFDLKKQAREEEKEKEIPVIFD